MDISVTEMKLGEPTVVRTTHICYSTNNPQFSPGTDSIVASGDLDEVVKGAESRFSKSPDEKLYIVKRETTVEVIEIL